MDEDIQIINQQTRNEKIRNFFINNRTLLIASISVILLALIAYLAFEEIKNKKTIELANKYNSTIINYSNGDTKKTRPELVNLIKEHNTTYSPLALYFIIDNEIIIEPKVINELFDEIINETVLEKEIKNLVIYKKALFNSDYEDENSLIKILNPLINSKSVWKSHALYLMAEYFYSKNEKQKAKDFFNEIIILENSNPKIKLETQKRLNRDFSD